MFHKHPINGKNLKRYKSTLTGYLFTLSRMVHMMTLVSYEYLVVGQPVGKPMVFP